MALPTGRNTTYSAGVQIESADMNDIQDSIIAQGHGEVTLPIPAAAGQASIAAGEWQFTPALPAVVATWWEGTSIGAANVTVHFPLPLIVGDRILAVRAFIQDTAGVHKLTLRLSENVLLGGTSTERGTADDSAGDGTNQTLSVGVVSLTVVAGTAYEALVETADATTTTHKVWGVEVDYDHP